MTETPREMMTIEFYGGPLDRQVSHVPKLPSVVYTEELEPLRVRLDDLDPMMPMPRRIANYELVRGPRDAPERDGGGRYIYEFKGYHHV